MLTCWWLLNARAAQFLLGEGNAQPTETRRALLVLACGLRPFFTSTTNECCEQGISTTRRHDSEGCSQKKLTLPWPCAKNDHSHFVPVRCSGNTSFRQGCASGSFQEQQVHLLETWCAELHPPPRPPTPPPSFVPFCGVVGLGVEVVGV